MMNFGKICMAAVMTAAVAFGGGSTVNGEEFEGGEDIEQFNGYSLNYCMAAVVFDSWEDYVKYSPEAREAVKNDRNEGYLEGYDYICVPAAYEDRLDDISQIFITPQYCLITFSADGRDIDFCHYFYADGLDYCYDYTESASKYGNWYIAGDTDIYKLGNKYYYSYDNGYFYVNSLHGFDCPEDWQVTKVYTDSRFKEEGGSLFCISGDGMETGWKELNGHRYYFRSKDGSAVCGGLADIGGVVYSFNDNGVCNGAYTGYGLTGDGSRVYYRDGKVSDDIR